MARPSWGVIAISPNAAGTSPLLQSKKKAPRGRLRLIPLPVRHYGQLTVATAAMRLSEFCLPKSYSPLLSVS